MIYLDHAATSWPKPAYVLDAMRDYLQHFGANPGRSGHLMSANAARIVFDAREALARLFGISDSRYLVFTSSCTHAVNLALAGWLRPGDHVVTTSMEHNAVMRPLRRLADTRALRVTVVQSDGQGRIEPTSMRDALQSDTRLVVVNHASNVCGTMQPLADIRQAIGTVPLLVDAAQTCGCVPFNVEQLGVDFLALSGHKALQGPPGVGCLYIKPGHELELEPLLYGGTGSASESDQQPDFLPDRFEAGTQNAPGIAGLGAAALNLLRTGIEQVQAQELLLWQRLWEGLKAIPGITAYGTDNAAQRTGVTAVNVEGVPADTAGRILDREYGIAVRVGLHCAPAAHRSLGTYPAGCIRLAPGAATLADEIDSVLAALKDIAVNRQKLNATN